MLEITGQEALQFFLIISGIILAIGLFYYFAVVVPDRKALKEDKKRMKGFDNDIRHHTIL